MEGSRHGEAARPCADGSLTDAFCSMGSAGEQFTARMKQQGVKAVVFDFDCTISIKHSGGRVRTEKLDAFLQDNISPCFQQVGGSTCSDQPHRLLKQTLPLHLAGGWRR